MSNKPFSMRGKTTVNPINRRTRAFLLEVKMPTGIYIHKKNRVFSLEHRENLKKNHSHYWKGKHHSTETMAKWKPGYNKKGEYIGFKKGELNPSCSSERRKAMREWRKGKKSSWITRRRQSRSMKETLKNPDILAKWRKAATGRKLSVATILKIYETRNRNHPLSVKGLISKLDNIYSKYIRLSHLTKEGYIICFTCGGFFAYRQIDCGHFVSRTHMNTRYMEENTQPQCQKCNRYWEGRKDVYALNLQKKYGIDILQRLNDKKNEIKQYTASELEDLILTYKQKIKDLGS